MRPTLEGLDAMKFIPAAAVFLVLAGVPAASQECMACHGDKGLKSASGHSLYVDATKRAASVHGDLDCSTCHQGVKEYPHPVPMPQVLCATCHDDAGRQVSQSVHGLLGDSACTSCHGKAHEIGPASAVVPAQCTTCHEEAVRGYLAGVHAAARETGDRQTPNCLSCHGRPHQILPASDPKSPVNHLNIPATCGTCHGQKFVMEKAGQSNQPFVAYQQSVHGRAVASGSQKAAVCTDCHGVHEILSAADDKSPIFKFNVPATCGKCHQQVQYEFMVSIHGQAISHGNSQAPVCTDCHGIHTIKSHIDPSSPVTAQNLARSTCGRCHEGVRLSREFGLAGARVTSYLESYHGLASQLGSQVVANCASCHGAHYILPSSDPRSTINRANLVHTCGQCHPGITEKFVAAKVHIEAPLSSDIGSKVVRWVQKIYVSLIVVVIGGMVLHNFIIWRRKAVLRRKEEDHRVTRMTASQRVQHILLFSSFIVLAVTGFALKYPDSWLSELLGLEEKLRRTIHRTAGIVLIATSLYHLAYVLLTRDGRRLLRDFIPVVKDATDVVGTLAYYLGLKACKPGFARFSYAEKAEYWALVWGVAVMAGTGVMLWAKVFFGNLLPRWWLDVATAIHFYEAVLATLAILVWHLYQVMLDPDVYPMNWAWWNGRMSLEHYKDEHSLDADTVFQAIGQTTNATEDESVGAVNSHESKSGNDEARQDNAGS